MDVRVTLFLFVVLIHNVNANVADLQFCLGGTQDVRYSVSELYFYRYRSTTVADPSKDVAKRSVNTLPEHTRCICDISPPEPLTLIRLSSTKKSTPCYDWVNAYMNRASHNHTCQTSRTEWDSRGGTNQTLRLTLYEGERLNNSSAIPLRVEFDPTQPYLKVKCYAENVTSETVGDISVESTTRVSTTSSTFPTPTTESEESSTLTSTSEANFTPLVVGIVALAVLAGTCIVCFVLCRTVRKERQPDGPPERFHQTVHRKASNMLRVITAKRPLPHLPQSLKRKPKFPVTIQESGLYDSIRSKQGHNEDQTRPKHLMNIQRNNTNIDVRQNNAYNEHHVTLPKPYEKQVIAPQVSNDSSLYIHPIEHNPRGEHNKDLSAYENHRHLEPSCTQPSNCRDNSNYIQPSSGNDVTDPTYLTSVIFHETNGKSEQKGTYPNIDNGYVSPVSNYQKSENIKNIEISDNTKPIGEVDSENIDNNNVSKRKDSEYENLKKHPKAIKVHSTGSDIEYMSMGGMDDCVTESSNYSDHEQRTSEQIPNTVKPENDTVKIDNEYENSGFTDATFPELLRFQSLIEQNEKKALENSEDKFESGV